MPEATPPAVSPETPPATPPAEPPANPPSPPAAPDWRSFITKPELKEQAARFVSLDALAQANIDQHKLISRAIIPPGKDAKPEQIADYRSKMGVPESADGYKFHTPEGYKPSDAEVASQKEWAKDFHDLNLSADAAFKLTEKFNQRIALAQQAQVAADKEFAAASEAALKKAWGADYEPNKQFAKTAAEKMFGKNVAEAFAMRGKDGTAILDHPVFIEALAAVGREMGEPGMRGTVSAELRAPMQDQYNELTRKIHDARGRNDHMLVRQLDAQRMTLAEKLFPGTNAPSGAQAA